MFQYVGEGQHLAAGTAVGVAKVSVMKIVCGYHIFQRAGLEGVVDGNLRYVEIVVGGEVRRIYLAGMKAIEESLRVAQGVFERRRGHDMVGMSRRHAQRFAALHDVFAKSGGQFHHALLALFGAYGVIVQAPAHAREVGIIEAVVVVAGHFLEYHGHLLLVDDVAGGVHVGLAVGIEHGGIYRLDGRAEHVEPSLGVL